VQCAIEVQRELDDQNASLPEDRRMAFRMGVNLGDVIAEDGTIHGDGVNVAARLEKLAKPGGVCIGRTIYDQVKGRLAYAYDDLGEQRVHNITEPVRAYHVRPGNESADSWRGSPAKDVEGGDPANSMSAVLQQGAAPRKSGPSIAVLPFANLAGDPTQQHLSDGITEDIITELSRYRELFVIARSSSFSFRGRNISASEIGRILGAVYMADGSLRKLGNRIRVSVQLVEAGTSRQIWAERYDRDLEDIFAIQDEIARTIAVTLVGHIERSHAEQTWRRPTSSWAAYDYVLQARQCVDHYDTKAAKDLLGRAITLDPGYANAHAMLAWAGMQQFFDDSREETLNTCLACAEKALSLDDNDFFCHCAMGLVLTFYKRFDVAELHLDRAVALNPNSTLAAVPLAQWMSRVGRTREALRVLDMVALRDPLLPPWYWECRSGPLFTEKRYEEMIRTMNRKSPLQYYDHAHLAAAYAYLGRDAEARTEAAEVLRMKPGFSIGTYAKQEPFKDPANLEHLLVGFRKAGLPG
jgi:TolB-like protein